MTSQKAKFSTQRQSCIVLYPGRFCSSFCYSCSLSENLFNKSEMVSGSVLGLSLKMVLYCVHALNNGTLDPGNIHEARSPR